MLILLGCGNIVTNPKDAEYVIITDKDSNEAKDLFQYQLLLNLLLLQDIFT